MRQLVFYLIIIFTPYTIYAQDANEVALGVFVRDTGSQATLNTAAVSILDADSNLLISVPKPHRVFKDRDVFRYPARVTRKEKYIIKVIADGYETKYQDLFVKNTERIKQTDVFIMKKTIQLEEVVVTGSKILMVNRGDTIIYNASALQLSSSSMLDALIRQLPGVELDANGRITVNGKFVKSLLVNGRDFFKGDPKIALQNLPSYYVDKVKVYHEADKARKVMFGDSIKADANSDQLMMDVQLKKEYAEGWLLNADIGVGQYSRKLARLFAMRYTKHSGLYLYGNANNVNDNQSVGKDGKWDGQFSDTGRTESKRFGIGFDGDDKDTGMEYNLSADFKMADSDQEEIVSTNSYYQTGSVYQRSRSTTTNKSLAFTGKGYWEYPKTGVFLLRFIPWLSIDKTKQNALSRNASFSDEPYDAYRGASIDSLYSSVGSYRLTQKLILQEERQNLGETHYFSTGANGDALLNIWEKWMNISIEGYYHDKSKEEHSLWHLNRQPAQPSQTVNHFEEAPERSYQYQGEATFHLKERPHPNSLGVNIGYGYKQEYQSGRRQLYDVGSYANYKDNTGSLPSTTDSLQAIIDIKNSFYTSILNRTHTLKIEMTWDKWKILLPVAWTNRRIKDYRSGKESILKDRKIVPGVFLSYGAMPFLFRYEYHTILPDMRKMLLVRDDANPLSIHLGNPDLESVKEHWFRIGWNKLQQKNQQRVGFNWSLLMTQDAISIAKQYDLTTGITTYTPSNIQGNWHTSCDFTFGKQIDKQRHVSFTTKTTAQYQHSVDYASTTLTSNYRNEVNNIRISEELKTSGNLLGTHLELNGGIRWTHAESKMDHFSTINAVDFNYGLNMTRKIWKNFDFDSDLTIWSRRGYTDHSMNDDILIWNLSLNYAFGKLGQWILKMEGHDILHQQNNVRSTINAQGRTEIWYNTVPAYWMAHVIYQFKKEPNNRER